MQEIKDATIEGVLYKGACVEKIVNLIFFKLKVKGVVCYEGSNLTRLQGQIIFKEIVEENCNEELLCYFYDLKI